MAAIGRSGNDLYLDFNPAAPVPEPGTWALTIAGILGLLARRRLGREARGRV